MMNEKQQKAILLLAEGRTGEEIASALNVTPKTISIWRNDPEFRAALNQYLLNINTAHSERLRSLSGLALNTIKDCLDNQDLPAKERLSTAFKILELSKVSIMQPGSTDVNQIKKHDTLISFLN